MKPENLDRSRNAVSGPRHYEELAIERRRSLGWATY
jgi:hypothetical protein